MTTAVQVFTATKSPLLPSLLQTDWDQIAVVQTEAAARHWEMEFCFASLAAERAADQIIAKARLNQAHKEGHQTYLQVCDSKVLNDLPYDPTYPSGTSDNCRSNSRGRGRRQHARHQGNQLRLLNVPVYNRKAS